MKNIVCVFAHPDDEAFGPSGTIAKFSQNNNAYILCATSGEAGGHNGESKQEIAKTRQSEILKASKILGVKKVYFLGFEDGTLCNNTYHDLADKIKQYFEEIKPETVLTFEPQGVSGHIDHIAVSLATTFVFEKLPFIKKLLYYCLLEEQIKLKAEYFIYFPRGYSKNEVDLIFDVSSVWDKKIKAIQAHRSQQSDIDRIIPFLEKSKKEEYFLVYDTGRV